MSVGALQETIVVTSASPIVDTRNVNQVATLTDEVIESLPTGRTVPGLAALIPALTNRDSGKSFQDVGGLVGEDIKFQVHGSEDNATISHLNGMPFYHTDGGTSGPRADVSTADEFTLETSGTSAESRGGGVVMNIIMKAGGNRFSGSFIGAYANEHFQSSNLDDDLRARGLEAVNTLEQTHDLSASLGGPIKQDRVWFWGNLRHWGTNNTIAGLFHDSNVHDVVYTPDLSRQAHEITWQRDSTVRTTWQASQKHKVQGLALLQDRKAISPLVTFAERIRTPEAQLDRTPDGLGFKYQQLLWSAPITSRLLLEGGYSRYRGPFTEKAGYGGGESIADNYSITDLGTNTTYNYPGFVPAIVNHEMNAYKAALSYVTGSHAFKTGLMWETGQRGPDTRLVNKDMTLTVINGVPSAITLEVSPQITTNRLNAMVGTWVSDQWTRDRLTLNLGLRFDYHNGSVPAQQIPAGRFIPARDFAELKNVPNWKDLSPRVSAAYDLFGNGKTALKMSMSRYVAFAAFLAIARAANPVATTVNTANRTWTDLNGNFVPECDFLAPAPNGECGRLGNVNFGTQNVVTRYDDAITNGFGVRPYNWEHSALVQHELTPRVGLTAGYFRRSFSNFMASDNLLVTPADYDPYCITTPVDSRLPGGGGQQECGFYDIKPNKFGQSNTLVTDADQFGKWARVYDGVDVSFSARLRDSMFMQGGVSTGRTRENTCFAVDSPQALHFCDVRPPFQPQIKLLGSFPLPRNVQVSATFQTYPGEKITATYNARSAEIAPTLERNLSAGANATVPVELVEPGTMYAGRLYQFDLRSSKTFAVGKTRIRANVDVFNIFNANTVLALNKGYSASNWQRPLAVLYGRLAKLGVEVTF